MTQIKNTNEYVVPLRVTLVAPPSGVAFCMQAKGMEMPGLAISSGKDLSFDFSVRAELGAKGDVIRFLGPFTQGPVDARFVYICSGTMAGQLDSCWTRRAKIPLGGITGALIDEVRKGHHQVLEARIKGTAKDGGPACATCPLLDGGWKIIND